MRPDLLVFARQPPDVPLLAQTTPRGHDPDDYGDDGNGAGDEGDALAAGGGHGAMLPALRGQGVRRIRQVSRRPRLHGETLELGDLAHALTHGLRPVAQGTSPAALENSCE